MLIYIIAVFFSQYFWLFLLIFVDFDAILQTKEVNPLNDYRDDNYITLDNCMILTVNESNDFIENGRIIIRGHIIESIGTQADLESKGHLYDMHGRIIMPGLINTHTHSPSTLFRGLADDKFLQEWLNEYMWPAEKHLTDELTYLGSRLGYLEYLSNGMTTNVDMWYFADAISRAAEESGLRSVIASGTFAFPTPQSANSLQDTADYLENFEKRKRNSPHLQRIIPCVGPHDVYSTNPALLKECVQLSKKYDTMIHMHLSETQLDNEHALNLYNMTPTQVVENAGIFERKTLFAHCIYLSDNDMDIFKKYNASISYNPVTNLKLCEGILPISKLREKGINVSMGVDGAQSNNSLDLLSDTKTGVLIQKVNDMNPCTLNAVDAIRMVTINGAKAIGLDNVIGSLEPGKYADLISFDIDIPSMTPILNKTLENISSHIIYTDTTINDVMVNGEFLLKDKTYCKLDVSSILKDTQEAADYITKKLK